MAFRKRRLTSATSSTGRRVPTNPAGAATSGRPRSRTRLTRTPRAATCCAGVPITARLSEAENRYLDTLTYREYLEKVRGYDAAVTRMVEPIVGLLAGVSTDAACARLGRQLVQDPSRPMALSFPGGNSPFPRALLRALVAGGAAGAGFRQPAVWKPRFPRPRRPHRERAHATRSHRAARAAFGRQ